MHLLDLWQLHIWFGFVGHMVVDSLVECCFFAFFSVGVQGRHFSQTEPASCQVFLPNVTGQSWPVMASRPALPVEVQPMDVICRLWLHTCSPWALRRGIATGQFVWSLIAMQQSSACDKTSKVGSPSLQATSKASQTVLEF